MLPRLTIVAVLTLLAACTSATAPSDARGTSARAVLEIRQDSHAPSASCSFSRGTTTCTSTTQSTVTSTHGEVSGCLLGPSGPAGRRTRTFEDTFLVTVTATTLSHGRAGPVYSTTTTSSQQLLTSVQISDVCEAL